MKKKRPEQKWYERLSTRAMDDAKLIDAPLQVWRGSKEHNRAAELVSKLISHLGEGLHLIAVVVEPSVPALQ